MSGVPSKCDCGKRLKIQTAQASNEYCQWAECSCGMMYSSRTLTMPKQSPIHPAPPWVRRGKRS